MEGQSSSITNLACPGNDLEEPLLLPRAEGDGMESSSGKGTSPPKPHKPQKMCTPTAKYVPWEPRKAATEPYSDVVQNAVRSQKNVKHSKRCSSLRSKMRLANLQDAEVDEAKIFPTEKLKRYAIQKTEGSPRQCRHASHNSLWLSEVHVDKAGESSANNSCSYTPPSFYYNSCESADVIAGRMLHSDESSERGGTRSGSEETDVQTNDEPKSLAESELVMQMGINTELKRLLVASVGEDIHHKLDSLVHNKAQVTFQLQEARQQIIDLYEQMERLAIQCDVWRSKFLASKVMVQELSVAKSSLLRTAHEGQNAINDLFMEHEIVRKNLADAYKDLRQTQTALAPHPDPDKHVTPSCSIVDLSATVCDLSKVMRAQLLPPAQGPPPLDTRSDEILTDAERNAQSLLVRGVQVPQANLAHNKTLIDRFHSHAKYDSTPPPSCCKKCKGELKII